MDKALRLCYHHITPVNNAKELDSMTTFNFDMRRIGRTIAGLRREHNMTQMALADAMGVSFQAVSNWERGQSMPDISKLPELAELFSTTIDALLGREAPLVVMAAEDKLDELTDLSVADVAEAAPLLPPSQMDELAVQLTAQENLPDMTALLPYLPISKVDELLRQHASDDADLTTYAAFASIGAIDDVALHRLSQEEAISRLLPFMSIRAIDTLARRREADGQSTDFLLSYMSTAALNDLALLRLKAGRDVSGLLPFLSPGMLQRLIDAASSKA